MTSEQTPQEIIATIEARIGYTFKNKKLLETAFTHRSAVGKNGTEYFGRLELLGDSVLRFLVSEWLYKHFPEESNLSSLCSNIVCNQSLAHCMKKLELAPHILLSKELEDLGARKSMKLHADIMEAMLGAVHDDGGMEAAKAFVHAHIISVVPAVVLKNPKQDLKEWAERNHLSRPVYRVKLGSPTNARPWVMRVSVGKSQAIGRGDTKGEAEKDAAENLLKQLQGKGYER